MHLCLKLGNNFTLEPHPPPPNMPNLAPPPQCLCCYVHSYSMLTVILNLIENVRNSAKMLRYSEKVNIGRQTFIFLYLGSRKQCIASKVAAQKAERKRKLFIHQLKERNPQTVLPLDFSRSFGPLAKNASPFDQTLRSVSSGHGDSTQLD